MKKIYISLVAVAMTTVALAQPTNLGFENWTSSGSYSDPDGWQTANQYASQIFISPPVTKVSTNPAEGSFAASMATRYCAICGTLGVPIDTIPGIMIQNASIVGKPTSLSFKYKYAGVNGDNGGALIELTKWDAIIEDNEVIGSGSFIITANSGAWVDATVTIDYFTADFPDSISITFTSSARAALQDDSYPPSGINSALTIDAISIGMPSGTVSQVYEIEATVYAAHNNITIETKDLKQATYEIFTVTGQRVVGNAITNTKELVATTGFASGIYFVKVSSANGSTTKKVIVQ